MSKKYEFQLPVPFVGADNWQKAFALGVTKIGNELRGETKQALLFTLTKNQRRLVKNCL